MPPLKPIANASIGRALSRAERYRLLNEPREAESICRDILAVDPGNADALTTLLLALTDMFAGMGVKRDEARALLGRLAGDFERAYYAGVIDERWAKALLASGHQREIVHDFVASAMQHFEAAEALAPDGNDDAILRYNACLRMIERNNLAPAAAPQTESVDHFEDDMPAR